MKVHKTGVLLAVLVMAAAGCRGGDEESGEISAPGVTDDACPEAVNADNGCIYLGSISDLTAGPFAALGVPITAAQEAFWARVNDEGGIGGYDIDVTEYVEDNLYDPGTHSEVFATIEPEVLALAQTLGTPTTQAILERMQGVDMIGAPASWTSLWGFEDAILESGSSYCVDAMNTVDYLVEQEDVQSVLAVGFPGDYGGDGAAGAEIAAEANGIDFESIETAPGQEAQGPSVSAIVEDNPDLVILGTGPTETGVIVGQAAAQGYEGSFVGLAPTWNPALLASPAAEALEGLFRHAGPWGSYGTDTPGHTAMRDALGEVEQANDGYTAGWVWSYPLKSALEEWLDGDYSKDRAGLAEAVGSLESVDFEGMLPEEAGDRTQDNDIFTQTILSTVDPEADAGLAVAEDFFTGPTAEAFDFTGPCFE